MGIQLVWLKRDLRVSDHAPLTAAAARGPVVVLYVYEPELITAPEHDASHLRFVNECLAEVDAELRSRGHDGVTYRVGAMPDVLEALHREAPIAELHSHEETGGALTYARDKRVAAWAKARGVPWTEHPQTGVIRRLKTRDGWAKRWHERMSQPLVEAPLHLIGSGAVAHEGIRAERDLGLAPSTKHEALRGGATLGHEVLESFLAKRGMLYRSHMSSPVEGWEGCSRLSPYLAYGATSMREVFHATRHRVDELRSMRSTSKRDPEITAWLQSLSSFEGRLHWHCHFMQKLEDEPQIEFENMSRAADGLRENDHRQELFDAWCAGKTGYPLVDACMRALHSGGWLNFRMRAMLMSFAAYHLWLHWRPTSVVLATQFLDFEPGIHFSQAQMQSGTTGINAVRIYSPTKQVHDQDPRGVFIRRYVPELEGIPDAYLAEPWKMPPLEQIACGIVIGKTYPPPIVDHAEAVAEAKRRIFAKRRSPDARQEAARVFEKHGSRRSPRTRTRASEAEGTKKRAAKKAVPAATATDAPTPKKRSPKKTSLAE
jgi:deoxyribodipyrimidine photo-lyase